jgi:hypothetical protein
LRLEQCEERMTTTKRKWASNLFNYLLIHYNL